MLRGTFGNHFSKKQEIFSGISSHSHHGHGFHG